jgi:hypothetical protein
MTRSAIAKTAAIAVIGLCIAISACSKKGDASAGDGSEFSSAFASGTSDSDLGSSAPSEVANSQLPGMAPAYSASGS